MKIFLVFFITASLFFIFSFQVYAQVSGLSGWSIFIDPGHSQKENMGVYNYSEAEKTLRVGLDLRDLLLANTDIDTVYISRTNDQQMVSLTQRTDMANSLGASWYHSIHSDAGEPGANSTLLLWGQYSNGEEKVPNGGKAMSDIMVSLLTQGYRTTTRGSYGDCTFYGCSGSGPYLHVNRESTMPSELSEAGFHTNPKQNQLNMNEEWKLLEAYTLYWSILQYHVIDKRPVGILTGIISDIESAIPINGAVITLNGQADTTDTYESLFYKYSNDSSQLRNGFYFLENIPAGAYPVIVQAEGFDPYIDTVTIADTFFTFKDIQLISRASPYITAASLEQNDSLYPGIENIGIIFSRPMNIASVEAAIQLSPAGNLNIIWSDQDKRLAITTSGLDYNTEYQLSISGSAKDKYGHPFDGDGNGTGADDYVINFKTKAQDFFAPFVQNVYPSPEGVDAELNPIISLSFNEKINSATLTSRIELIKDSDKSIVSTILKHYIIGQQSTANLFVTGLLSPNERYILKLEPGIKDILGNETTSQFTWGFTTGNQHYDEVNIIDNYEEGIGNWWAPQQSGSTTGIITEQTGISASSNNHNYILGGNKSMNLNYAWDTTAQSWLLREYYSPTGPLFNSSNIVQAYIYGDGTGNKFRFAVRDSKNEVEVSPWYDINWAAWKLVKWDMTNDGTGSWVGDGVLNNSLKFDSFQLTYEPGRENSGELYFDDLRIVNETIVSVDESKIENIPSDYALEQNYPNPFNPSTSFKFQIPEDGLVELKIYDLLGKEIATLVNEERPAGAYNEIFNAVNLASGMYYYQLNVNGFTSTRKMLLLK